MKNYTHFSFEERKKIYRYLEVKLSVSKIAEKLGRHKSCVYREIKRNRVEGKYIGSIANEVSTERRRKSRRNKIRDNPKLNNYIFEGLKVGWSPEQISGRLKLDKKDYYVCQESIYRYIYNEKDIEWYKYLHHKRKRRYKHCGRHRQVRYSGGKSIHDRTPEIEGNFGHWEGDTIAFRGERNMNITTLVERKTLYTLLTKNATKTSAVVMSKIKELIKSTPKKYWETLTFDQGGEFADFKKIERNSKCLVYYCDPKSPWQRGVNENTNGRIRKYLPKNANIEQISDEEIAMLNEKLNQTPRKKLGYLMPKEALALELKTRCRT
jgi:transposase, IS30 family